MNWVTFRRLAYLPMVLACWIVAISVCVAFQGDVRVLLGVAALLFVPGIVMRWLLSDLLESRKRMNAGDFQGALEFSQRFLEACGRRSWIRHAIWGGIGVYTLDVVAMGLNNAGGALTELGRLDEAERFLNAAREADPHYPMPVFNLARVARLRGDEAGVEAFGREARELGMPGNSIDAMLAAVGNAYARVPR